MSDYSSNFPQQRPSLNLDFANSGKLDSRISFSRADTPPTYAAPSAVHYWSNEKHKSSENLVTQSDGSDWIFDTADYAKTASQNGPDGSTNATKFTEKANGTVQYQVRSQNFIPIANQEITYSVWLKQTSGSRDYQQIRVGNIGSNMAFATYNLTNGTVDQTGGTLGVSASVNAGPTGWYQCVLRFTPTSTTALTFYIYAAAASGGEVPNVTGDTGNSYTLFGAQASTLGETVVNETSGQIHRSYSSTLKSVANAGDPRFEYDPTDGQSEGLLIEQQYTQYSYYSEEFDNNGGWSKVNATVQPNAAVSPDGTLSADLLVEAYEASGTNSHYAQQNTLSSVAVGDTYTWTIFAKAAGRSAFAIYSSIGGSRMCFWDLTDGSVSQTSGTGSFSSSDCGNGWYRLEMTFTTTTTAAGSNYFYIVEGGTNVYQGNGYGSVLIWGANLTKTASSMSYVKAESTTVTKSADSCSVALSDAGYNGGPVTGIVEANNIGKPYPTFATLTDSTANQRVMVQGSSTASIVETFVVVGGSVVANPNSALTLSSSKVGFRCDTDNFATVVNGGTVATDTSGPQPATMTTLHIGSKQDGNFQVNGTIGRLSLYSAALSNVELQSLTSNP